MLIIKPYIFHKYPEIIYGFSTKIVNSNNSAFGFNLSDSVGDEKSIVESNRSLFFNAIGLDKNSVAFQKQTHSDIINIVESSGNKGESDALITNQKNLGLAITIADCTPIFIYDHKNKVIAGVHSGWRGTEKKILLKTLELLNKNFNSNPQDMIVYLGPSISQANYEVGSEVADIFDAKYVSLTNGKLFLDISMANYHMLLEYGIPKVQIQKSELCTFEFTSVLHSYRRDREKSGRSLGVIAIKG